MYSLTISYLLSLHYFYYYVEHPAVRLFSRIPYLLTSSKLLVVRGLISFSRSLLWPILKEMNTVINSAKHETESPQEFMVNTLVHQSVCYHFYSQSDSKSVNLSMFIHPGEETRHEHKESFQWRVFEVARESGTDHKLSFWSSH